MKYRITEAAYQDLNDIWLYTFQEWSEIQASKYFESIIEEIALFSENPSKEETGNGKLRILLFWCILSLCIFKYGDEKIDIIILHKMMDFPKHLK